MSHDLQFLYFDLGNVLLHFDTSRVCARIAHLAGLPEAKVRRFFAADDVQNRLERGELAFEDVYQEFCRVTETRPDADAVRLAASDIFRINSAIVPLVAQLAAANHRLGILSNTNRPHWDFVSDGRFAIVPDYFEVCTLSFQVGAMKPGRRIYEAATERAGVAPEHIFFTDDHEAHVTAAREFGWDAVPYRSVDQLAEELRARGVRFNYV
jgi:putative hydrolase of the HAD superfamily